MSYLCTVASLTFSLAQRSFFVYLLLAAAKAFVVFPLSTGIAGGFLLMTKKPVAIIGNRLKFGAESGI